jgi:phosphoglycolate phosphatase
MRPLPRPRAVVIDLDGTLVDTLGDFDLALNAMLADLGLPAVDRAFIERSVGKGSEHLIAATLAQAGAAADLQPHAWDRYQQHYLRINGSAAVVYPGVPEGLQRLRALGLPLACLTNKPAAFARPLLQRLGLDGCFAQVFGGDDFPRKKPDPLPLLMACEALGVAPADAWMIGDSSNDAQAAHAAGCQVVLLRHGYNHGEPIDAVPALAHLDRLDQIGPLLAR